MFLQQLVNGITIGSLYSLVALGLAMVYGIMRVLDIANAGAYALGAYLGVAAYSHTQNFLLALLAGACGAALTGYLFQRWIYTPIGNKDPIVPLVASIGLFTAMEDLFRLVAGPYTVTFPVQMPFDRIRLGPVTITNTQAAIMIIAVALFLLLFLVLSRTRIGLAWQAVAQDRETAMAMGINTRSVVAFAFLLGYSFAAIAGILVAIRYNAVFPAMGSVPSYKMLAIVVLGGLGNPAGAIVAALVLGLVETFVAGYVAAVLPTDAIAFMALILLLLVRPQGLLGKGGGVR